MDKREESTISVLFVDDEPSILNSLKRGLIGESYIKLFANSGEEALRMMAEQEVSVIVTDMKMPVMNGLELLKIVAPMYPEVVKIVLSGYNQLPQVLATINTIDVFKYIVKPWDMDHEFIPVLNQAIEQYQMKKAYRHINELLEKKNEFYSKIIKVNDERFMKLRNEFLETSMYTVESMRGLNAMVNDMLLEKATAEEVDHAMKSFNRILTSYIEWVPTEGITYAVRKTISGVENMMKTWYELLSSKKQGAVKPPLLRLGALENLAYTSILGPKQFEQFIKLVLFELALYQVEGIQEPYCEILGFYESKSKRMILEVKIHELIHPTAKHLRSQLMRCYSKVFELYGGECVHYVKSSAEHFIVTLPVVE